MLKIAYRIGYEQALEKQAGVGTRAGLALGLGALGGGVGAIAGVQRGGDPRGAFFGLFPPTPSQFKYHYLGSAASGAIPGLLLGAAAGASLPSIAKVVRKLRGQPLLEDLVRR